MNALSDSHSIQHSFEELEVEEDGFSFGCFSGTAELASNGDGDFYVKHIILDVVKRVQRVPGGVKWPVQTSMNLPRISNETRTFKAHLFRKIETALYANDAAKEAWASEILEAA